MPILHVDVGLAGIPELPVRLHPGLQQPIYLEGSEDILAEGFGVRTSYHGRIRSVSGRPVGRAATLDGRDRVHDDEPFLAVTVAAEVERTTREAEAEVSMFAGILLVPLGERHLHHVHVDLRGSEFGDRGVGFADDADKVEEKRDVEVVVDGGKRSGAQGTFARPVVEGVSRL
jgi:hypothetical protein